MNFRGKSYGPMALLLCFQGNSYGPTGLKIRHKLLALVHGGLFPGEPLESQTSAQESDAEKLFEPWASGAQGSAMSERNRDPKFMLMLFLLL